MPSKRIARIEIPVKLPAPAQPQPRKRVAAYARVSTMKDAQENSLQSQQDYFAEYIRHHPDWVFAGIYTDEGISAVNTKHRDGFNRMIRDALAGKIDLIVTKSVSRFARNTVDSLTTIRKLKEAGCECFFQKENIMTFDSKGELLITIMSSLAQEESRSISENVTWGSESASPMGKSASLTANFWAIAKARMVCRKSFRRRRKSSGVSTVNFFRGNPPMPSPPC